jgi:hypothetical protein
MDEMITAIYEITIKMKNALVEEQFQVFEELLSNRNEVMVLIDNQKAKLPEHQYTEKTKNVLADILLLDQEINTIVQNEKFKVQLSLNQLKNKKQASIKYQPYSKQTNGVFVDKTK